MRTVGDKTTTVRILGTLISATAGSAAVAGLPVGPATAARIRKRISVMPEPPGLHQRLTVAENLDFFARLYGLPQRDERIKQALAAVLDPVAAHEVHGLIAGLAPPAWWWRGCSTANGSSRAGSTDERRRAVSATLKLTRKGMGIELRRGRFAITVDGRDVGAIDYGDTFETPVEPSRHTLRLRAGRYSSRDHSFDAADGEMINFRCHGAMVWPRWLVSFARPDLAIALLRE
ncbi:MAG TPA: hypothetical protein VG164_08445 [Trebonia sp.]|nr:hypothetical protein [Trebonia sp.]